MEPKFNSRKLGKPILVLEDGSHLADPSFGAVKKVHVRSYSELQWWDTLSTYVKWCDNKQWR